jgi:hypothetical protein
MVAVERALFYLNFIAEIVLLGRLIQSGLYRTYQSLFLYWLLQTLGTVALLGAPAGSFLYLYLYEGVQTVNLLMALFVVRDLFRIALTEHPAVASVGRRSVVGAMLLAAALGLVGIALDASTLPAGHYWAIHDFATFERTLNFVILIFLLLISGFLLWFPIRVRRNILVYILGFVVFAAARFGGLLAANLLPQTATRLVSVVLLGISLLCLLFWTVGIRPEGERSTASPGSRRDPEAMRRLSRQLDAINQTLARFVRS